MGNIRCYVLLRSVYLLDATRVAVAVAAIPAAAAARVADPRRFLSLRSFREFLHFFMSLSWGES